MFCVCMHMHMHMLSTHFLYLLLDKEEAVSIQSIQSMVKSKPKFCRHCDWAVLSPGIRKKKTELPFITKEEQVIVFSFMLFPTSLLNLC